jgi:hypothetical protein
MRETHRYVDVSEGRTTVVVYVAIVQFDKHALKNAMTEVLVDAVAQIVRDIANLAPQECEAIGVDAVEKVQCGVNVRKYDQPDIDRKVRHRSCSRESQQADSTLS